MSEMRNLLDRLNRSWLFGEPKVAAKTSENETAPKPAYSLQEVCVLRPPKPDDYGRMAELAGQLGYECSENEVRVRVEEMRDSSQYSIFVAEIPGGRIAGWIGAYVFRAVEVDRCTEISGLVVDEQVRSRGVGKALLDTVEQWAITHGCRVVSVRSNVTRSRAHGFYERNGYTRIKTQQTFRKFL